MNAQSGIRLHAGPARRLVWIVLALLLVWASATNLGHGRYLAGFIAVMWLLFALSWVVNLFRLPIATVTEDAVVLLERLRFGRANWMVIRRGQLIDVQEIGRGRIALTLVAMGDRRVNLKYLRPRDREMVVQALQRLAHGAASGERRAVQSGAR